MIVLQTDTGRLVEYTKADGEWWFKELGIKTERKLCKMLWSDIMSDSQQKCVNRLFN